MLQKLSRLKRALLLYSMFIISVIVLALYAIIGSQKTVAQNPRCGVPYCDDACRSCGPTGCSGTCTGNPINEFYCRGETAGCGDGMPTYLGYDDVTKGNVTPQNRYLDLKKKIDGQVIIQPNVDIWCSTVQVDAKDANNDFVVISIGDGGAYCWEGFSNLVFFDGCSGVANPGQLDWDCAVVTPTPTPPITTPPVTTPPVTTPPQCPQNVDAQFWYYFPDEKEECDGDPISGCGGLTGWISGADINARNPVRPFYLDVNCFQNNGASPLLSPRTELYKNGVKVLTANDFKLRDYLISDAATFSAKCIYRATNILNLECNQDSFTTAQVPTTPPVTTPPPQPQPGLQIEKAAINETGSYGLGQPVIYRIRISNTGETLITSMTFRDMYNVNYLDFIRIVDPVNGRNITTGFTVDENIGIITIQDLTLLVGDFWPGRVLDLQFEFVTRRAIDTTCNDVFVNPSFGERSARDCVRISAPLPVTDL